MKNRILLATALLMGGVNVFSLANVQASADFEQNNEQKNHIVDVIKEPDLLVMTSKENVRNITLKIKGPDGIYSHEFLGDSSLSIYSEDFSELKDGTYTYEITGSSDKLKKKDYKDTLNHGRNNSQKAKKTKQYQSISQSGTIVIKNGQIVVDEIEEPAYTGDNQ